MRDETLLDRAKINFNVSIMIRKQMGEDDAYLNCIGYHLQQAVEMGLKYQLENSGITYPKTHDIDQLIRIGNENDVDLHLTDYIEDHSEMFTLWESRTRYVLNYQLEKKKTDAALIGVSEFLDEIEKDEINYEEEYKDEYEEYGEEEEKEEVEELDNDEMEL